MVVVWPAKRGLDEDGHSFCWQAVFLGWPLAAERWPLDLELSGVGCTYHCVTPHARPPLPGKNPHPPCIHRRLEFHVWWDYSAGPNVPLDLYTEVSKPPRRRHGHDARDVAGVWLLVLRCSIIDPGLYEESAAYVTATAHHGCKPRLSQLSVVAVGSLDADACGSSRATLLLARKRFIRITGNVVEAEVSTGIWFAQVRIISIKVPSQGKALG